MSVRSARTSTAFTPLTPVFPAVLAERMKRMIRTERVALVSVRSPAEIESLRELDGFVLLAVDAPVEVRFAREKGRRRESAVKTLEEFVELEERENTTDPNAQQLSAAIGMADRVIENNGSFEDFEGQLERLLDDLHD